MLCEKCNSNEATIHYTEIINGVKNEHHLCSECAKEADLGLYSDLFDGEFSFANLIKSILANGNNAKNQQISPLSQIVCPKCHMTYEEFTKEGKFGCAECYNVFGPLIMDNLKKIQGSLSHTGKTPEKPEELPADIHEEVKEADNKAAADNIEELRLQLKHAVQVEEYDEAARLRDEIRRLERNESHA